MTEEEYDKYVEDMKHSKIEHVECLENMSGGMGTYSLKVDVLKSDDKFIKITRERSTKNPSIEPGEFPTDVVYNLKVEEVEKVSDEWVKWRVISKVYEETVYSNKYNDGRTKIKVLED